MSAKEKVISWAESWIGYLEKRTPDPQYLSDKTANAGSNNYTIFAANLAKTSILNGSKQGQLWCAVFCIDDFYENYGQAKTLQALHIPERSAAAGCYYFVNYLRSANAYGSTPHVGDLIFFKDSDGDPCHIGIVYAVDSSKVYTIEGNTSGASGVIDNGGGVCRKSYSRSYSRIHGYGYPDYSVLETYTEGWVKDDNGWWYRYKDGSYPKDCWKKINAKWYCFDTEGYCLMSKWTMYNGNAYYLGSDGAMVINKTLKIDEEGKLVYAGDYYHLLSNVTSKTYREALDAAISKGFIKGEGGSGENLVLNLPEESVRMIVYLHRAGLF